MMKTMISNLSASGTTSKDHLQCVLIQRTIGRINIKLDVSVYSWSLIIKNILTSRKHAYIILTPLNPTFI